MRREIKRYRKRDSKSPEATTKRETSREIKAFKDPRQLPVLPLEVTNDFVSQMHRGNEKTRTEIHRDIEQTMPETKESSLDEAGGPELDKGVVVSKEWKIQENGSARTAVEHLEIIDKLSGKNNIAGDVWKAKKFWDGKFYGYVVLKTPKKRLRESRSSMMLARVYRDMDEEKKNLFRFQHDNIVSASGQPFFYNGEPVIQMDYQAWSVSDYLLFQKTEQQLSGALMAAAIQSLEAIAYLANKRDERAPNGYVHVDFKRDHMRLDHTDEKGWFVTIIDLDSIIPAGGLELHGTKYNPCVDPEKFMKLHNPEILVTAEPRETVYSLGLSLLYAISVRMRIITEKRKFKPEGLDQYAGETIATDGEKLKENIMLARMMDETNLLKVYYTNKFRRIIAGKFDQDPEPMRELIESYNDMPEIREEALSEVREGDPEATVHSNVFAGIMECLKQYSERYRPETMLERFRYLWGEFLKSEKYTE